LWYGPSGQAQVNAAGAKINVNHLNGDATSSSTESTSQDKVTVWTSTSTDNPGQAKRSPVRGHKQNPVHSWSTEQLYPKNHVVLAKHYHSPPPPPPPSPSPPPVVYTSTGVVAQSHQNQNVYKGGPNGPHVLNNGATTTSTDTTVDEVQNTVETTTTTTKSQAGTGHGHAVAQMQTTDTTGTGHPVVRTIHTVTSSLVLGGYSVASFSGSNKAAVSLALETLLGLPAGSVTVTGVYPSTAQAHGAGRRHLLDSSASAIIVVFIVNIQGTTAQAVTAELNALTPAAIMSALQAKGLSGVSSVDLITYVSLGANHGCTGNALTQCDGFGNTGIAGQGTLAFCGRMCDNCAGCTGFDISHNGCWLKNISGPSTVYAGAQCYVLSSLVSTAQIQPPSPPRAPSPPTPPGVYRSTISVPLDLTPISGAPNLMVNGTGIHGPHFLSPSTSSSSSSEVYDYEFDWETTTTTKKSVAGSGHGHVGSNFLTDDPRGAGQFPVRVAYHFQAISSEYSADGPGLACTGTVLWQGCQHGDTVETCAQACNSCTGCTGFTWPGCSKTAVNGTTAVNSAGVSVYYGTAAGWIKNGGDGHLAPPMYCVRKKASPPPPPPLT